MAVDMFLKLDGIKGESTDSKHGGEIHVESISFGMTQTGAHGTGGGGGAGKVNVQDITAGMYVEKSTPAFLAHCASGKHIPTGLITYRKAGDKPLEYLKIKLTGAKIVAPTTTHIVPTKGHIHVLLDGKIESMNYGINLHAIHDVKPGNHLLSVEFVASDHLPWDPRVVQEVTFTVKP